MGVRCGRLGGPTRKALVLRAGRHAGPRTWGMTRRRRLRRGLTSWCSARAGRAWAAGRMLRWYRMTGPTRPPGFSVAGRGRGTVRRRQLQEKVSMTYCVSERNTSQEQRDYWVPSSNFQSKRNGILPNFNKYQRLYVISSIPKTITKFQYQERDL